MEIKNLSLKHTLFIAIFAIEIPLLALLGIWGHFSLKNEIDEKFERLIDQSEKNIKSSFSFVDLALRQLKFVYQDDLLDVLKEYHHLYVNNKFSLAQNDLIRLRMRYEEKYHFHLIDADGVIIQTTKKADLGRDLTKYPNFYRRLKERQKVNKPRPIVDRPSTEISTGKFNLYGYYPVAGKNVILEVSSHINLNPNEKLELDLEKSLQKIKTYNPFLLKVNIYTAYGTYFGRKRKVKDASVKNLVVKVLKSNQAHDIYDYKNKILKRMIPISVSKSTDLTNAIYVIELTYNLKQKDIELWNKTLSNFGFIVLLLMPIIFLTYIIVNRFTSPIKRILDDIGIISKGNFDHKIRSSQQYELDLLGHNINGMVKIISDLSLDLINAQEGQKKKISSELHDSVSQTLAVAKIKFKLFDNESTPDKMKEGLFKEGLSLLDSASTELREIYTGLYPSMLSDLGIKEAIEWYVDYVFPKEIKKDINVNYGPSDENYDQINLHLFRIIQEHLSNVNKHSNCKYIGLYLEVNSKESFYLMIQDDGSKCDFPNESKKGNEFIYGHGRKNIMLRARELGANIEYKQTCKNKINSFILKKQTI